MAPRRYLMPASCTQVMCHPRPKTVMCHPRPKTVHDFFGFAEGLYEVEYCATCDAEHSARVAEALSEGGIPVEFEGNRGFDVGCWQTPPIATRATVDGVGPILTVKIGPTPSPMCLLFPAANIPVVQVSLHSGREGLMHLRMGQALGALRDIGYLILCTGGITFNLLELGYGDRQPPPAAVVWVKDVMTYEESKPWPTWVKDVMTYEEKKKWPTADAAWDARSQKLAQVFSPTADVSHAALLSHP
ncbi:Extradiol ring-cleavage dioxygenase, class III enzyme, subunit B [Baffinella frigidus]|nr:Extradiol ring-cleavage dioxygenase, class III enzyme, subunit B [Cryptophyta sp. CCMP2293]